MLAIYACLCVKLLTELYIHNTAFAKLHIQCYIISCILMLAISYATYVTQYTFVVFFMFRIISLSFGISIVYFRLALTMFQRSGVSLFIYKPRETLTDDRTQKGCDATGNELD